MRITIKTENAAFESEPSYEACRILHELADRLLAEGCPVPGSPYFLKDINGNTVGKCQGH